MPVYEFDCPACGGRFSRFFRSPAAASAVACPQCHAPDARRAISAFQVHQSLKTQIDNIDPQFEREMDYADRHYRADNILGRVNQNLDATTE